MDLGIIDVLDYRILSRKDLELTGRKKDFLFHSGYFIGIKKKEEKNAHFLFPYAPPAMLDLRVEKGNTEAETSRFVPESIITRSTFL